jgi:hypothetical protein
MSWIALIHWTLLFCLNWTSSIYLSQRIDASEMKANKSAGYAPHGRKPMHVYEYSQFKYEYSLRNFVKGVIQIHN